MAVIPSQQLSRISDDPPEEQFRQAVERAGLTPPPDIRMDGKIHRFHTGTGKKTEKSGWYVLYGGDIPAGAFGDWRDGDCYQTWRAEVSREVSLSEEQDIRERIKQAREAREAEALKVQGAAMDAARSIWEGAPDAPEDHPYLTKKGVKPHDIKVTVGDGRLIIPVYNSTGELVSLQYIDKEGNKQFHPGGKVSGCFYMIQGQGETIYMAEGYATAATIHEVTGSPVIIAFNAGNLAPVAQVAKVLYPNNPLTIVADNDVSGVGQAKAQEARDKTGANVIVTPVTGDANDYHLAGHDLKELLVGSDKPDWLVPFYEFVQKPAPIKWLVKGWLQANACMMMFGPSGSGKSFVAMDMALRIASGVPEWNGHKVRKGGVVYLAGEGQQGMKARASGWCSYHNIDPRSVDCWISKDGCDLNTEEGFARAVDNITKSRMKVSLIVVDTLHRFLSGDENSAQDAKTMLDACAKLMVLFNCSVLLVHHTGVSPEAQKRARGSSSWKGAQDIEISVSPKGDKSILVEQTKSKDTELAAPICFHKKVIDVPGWLDEDDEQVTTLILEEGEAESEGGSSQKMTPATHAAMESYRNAAYKKGRLTPKGFEGIHLEEWREVFYEGSTQENPESKRQAFFRARDGLVKKGILIVSNDIYKPTNDLEIMSIVLYLKENKAQMYRDKP